jgi:RimJ/RimL family protein N-acetyltransferase
MTAGVREFWLGHFGLDEREVSREPVVQMAGEEERLQISFLDLAGLCVMRLKPGHHRGYSDFLKGRSPDEGSLMEYSSGAGFRWNPPDLLFYADPSCFTPPPLPVEGVEVRRLTPCDSESFEEMTEACPEEDLDAGWVELDHEIVYGVFSGGRMVSRASAYPFLGNAGVYDIGYVTRPGCMGMGYGSLCAAALTADILAMGAVPQIRAQPENAGSTGIARKLGFRLEGRWLMDWLDD